VPDPTPPEQISRMLTGYWAAQAVYVAAKLRLADLLVSGPKSSDELASATGAHGRSLYRLLRALASLGVFSEDESHRFSLTPLAECLRSDVPGSQWALAVMAGEEHYHAWGDLLYSVRTGEVAFEKVYGRPVFDFLAVRPEQARIFDAAMTGVHGRETAAMLDAYDFSSVRVLADIGGGNGSTLCEVLGRYPTMRGVLFDLPGVIERARSHIAAAGLSERCQLVAGSFFESVPSGADAYVLRHIIHDWDDAKSATILRTIHKAMDTSAKLLVIETVILPDNEPNFGKLLDLAMLVIPGGAERTEQEYCQLYETAGFRLTRIVPTAAGVSIIEGERA
jgi:O-methyltransferase/methyltransferase family protein